MTAPRLVKEDVSELYEMLTFCRPHGSDEEQQFSDKFLMPLGMEVDDFGNMTKRIGDSPVAWSSHVDTVHHNGGRQEIIRDAKYIIGVRPKTSNCLGADDTAGVWLMTQMIKAKRPGLYMFHRGEERGRLGSTWIAKNNKEILSSSKFVIALDRMGLTSIITFQTGKRCCSDAFATSMAEQLGQTLAYKGDKSGMYTDSASYVDIVGECTNLSVGYFNQHMSSESLNLPHLGTLRAALMSVDHDKLVSKRKPGETEYRYGNGNDSYYYDNGYRHQGHHGNHGWRGNSHNNVYTTAKWREGKYSEKYEGGYYKGDTWVKCGVLEWLLWSEKIKLQQQNGASDHAKIVRFVKDHGDLIADMFLDWGFEYNTIKDCMVDVLMKGASSINDGEDGHPYGG